MSLQPRVAGRALRDGKRLVLPIFLSIFFVMMLTEKRVFFVQLNLGPASRIPAYRGVAGSAWGGGAMQDQQGTWHLFAAEFVGNVRTPVIYRCL
jgi:hypothetical protein